MESRKRPHVEDGDVLHPKKRLMTSANGSPHTNGVVTEVEEPNDASNLELFRKEAIFRRMKHYSREHERSQAQIAELRRQKDTCEAGLAAMAACWTQLTDALKLLARPEEVTTPDIKADDIFDLTNYVSDDAPPSLIEALRDNMLATKTLATKFAQSEGQGSMLHEEAYRKCQVARTECAGLRSEMALMRAQLRDSEAQKEKYYTQLIAAESRVDRLQSSTVAAVHVRSPVQSPPQKHEDGEVDLPNGSSPPAHPSVVLPTPELETLQALADLRASNLAEAEKQLLELKDKADWVHLQESRPSVDVIQASAPYKRLLEYTSKLEHESAEHNTEIAQLNDELNQLKSQRQEFEDGVETAAAASVQELKTLLAKRDNENLRLREQRDQQGAELNERKQKDSIKMASMQEWKILADSRGDRLVALESEVKRLKARIAANSGDKDILSFFMKDVDISYVEDLKSRLSLAEASAEAQKQSLSFFEDDHPDIVKHMKLEADARQQLAAVTKELATYKSVYGDVSTLPPDSQALAEQLRQKEEELTRLRLLETQSTQNESSLFGELDKLSSAWETLDREVKGKVFNLSSLEEKLVKAGHEKAKSENKFYAAIREKEAIEMERKNVARNLERQAKVLEKLHESEKVLTSQVSNFEKEVATLKKAIAVLQKELDSAQNTTAEWQARAEHERKRAGEYRANLSEKEQRLVDKKAELRKIEEGLIHTKKELERQLTKAKAASRPGSGAQREAELEAERDKAMSVLKCSTCHQRMRNTIITKCMHTFCRQCVDARLSTRQRKCPSCAVAFAVSDVETVFFQ
ncbi:hypothetical protein PLICRDRAFT_51174 [Plicaturopsis crispa FD-325 SS-3]|nr:hypothetical protein PLICRDRAFT_51174 [Plicaturopsis crispa FD-325 SS-3]